MNIEEIKELMDALAERDIEELELERGDEKIRIRRRSSSVGPNQPPYIVVSAGAPVAEGTAAPAVAPASSSPAPAVQESAAAGTPEPAQSKEEDEGHTVVTAPIVGTFFEAPSPESQPFVQVGDRVEPGQVLCIIEAMKLMNEIEAETGGVVVKRFVSNGQPVEYGESLFAIKPGS